jgi:LemA protein
MSFGIILLIASLVIFYSWYIAIITRRNKVLEALSGVDVHLKKRLDLIPNILKIAKKFMEHEEKIFNEVTALREGLQKNYNKKNVDEVVNHLQMTEDLSGKINNLMVRAESYPELRSSQNMIEAQQAYREVEDQIAAARRFYNAAVNSLSNSIQIFPGNVFAKIIGVKQMPLFQTQENVNEAIDAGKFL